MLAYDEHNRLVEFKKKNGYVACSWCSRVYRQRIEEQIPGFRDREYDICPYCGKENGSSMSYDYINLQITDTELSELTKTSLINEVVQYSHNEFSSSTCNECNHTHGCPGSCEGNCKKCLEEIHYPQSYPYGKKDYDCHRMLSFYVCDYAGKYMSEMLYLMEQSEALKKIDNYHVVSIGCGSCPDLMAFEQYCHSFSNGRKTVSYVGIDVNEMWSPFHDVIRKYESSTIKRTHFFYQDAVTEEYRDISRANVIILQYVISHFYNTNQIDKIDLFFEKLINKIVAHREEDKPFVLLINDVNSNNRGRDYFVKIIEMLKQSGFHGNSIRFYFDHGIRNDFQRYGTRHARKDIRVILSQQFDAVYEPWKVCSSAQLLVEVYEEAKK